MLLGVCLALAAQAGGSDAAAVFVEARRFTLAWTHSIERVRWEEDYVVHDPGGDRAPVLHAVGSRVRGSGAGMEPAPDATLRDGWYHAVPPRREHLGLWLTRSGYTADYELCIEGAPCRDMSHWLPSDGWRTRLTPCRDERRR